MTLSSIALRIRKAPHFLLPLLLALALLGQSAGIARCEPSDAYRLAGGDRIAIAVFGQVELSGEYLIDSFGSVTLPIVGAIDVGGLTLLEGQQRIEKALSEGYLKRPSVSIRMSEHRPIYVVGEVRNPGSYPYRHNATALSAIALAGGFGLVDPGQGTTADLLMADERVRSLETSRRALLVRQARLQAERNGVRSFDDSLVPAAAKGDDRTRSMVAGERETLETHRRALEKELELLRQQKPRLAAEIEAVKEQARAESKQLELIQVRLREYKTLQAKGLGFSSTGIELEREQARNQGQIQKLTAEMSRLELEIGNVEIRIQEAENAFQRRVAPELQETRSKLLELDDTLPAARELRDYRVKRTGIANIPGGEAAMIIKIIRMHNNEAQTLDATRTALLKPGDVVEVSGSLRGTISGRSLIRTRAPVKFCGLPAVPPTSWPGSSWETIASEAMRATTARHATVLRRQSDASSADMPRSVSSMVSRHGTDLRDGDVMSGSSRPAADISARIQPERGGPRPTPWSERPRHASASPCTRTRARQQIAPDALTPETALAGLIAL